MNPKKIFAIIPARGGSKGLPRKNVADLAGKPLISYSIEAALCCPYIDRVLVSTEDEEIKEISLKWGAEVIDRPVEIATDASQTHHVIRHVLEHLEKKDDFPDFFVMLQPTSPLRNAFHLMNCIDLLMKEEGRCLVSVTECEHHPLKTVGISHRLIKPFQDYKSLEMRRQDLPTLYRPNGAIYMMTPELFLESNAFFVDPIVPFVMNHEDSIDIDSLLDLRFAELLLHYKSKILK